MNDREMLEYAARAAGYDVDYENEYLTFFMRDQSGRRPIWNPIRDDGDAFRLAVKLQIEIQHAELAVIATHCDYNWSWLGEGVNEDHGDRYAATRLVLVRAAAEIGKAMEKNNG